MMSTPSNFDSLWDYDHPDQTEAKFREALTQLSPDTPIRFELLTQIARTQGLQGKFEDANKTLDEIDKNLEPVDSRARVRYLLERGRVLNSSMHPDQARPFFQNAREMAEHISEDGYAVDAIHMLAIVAPPDESLNLNLKAIELAEGSHQEKARDWLGSLYNNTGWSYHNLGNYEAALEIFKKGEAWQKSKGRVNERRIATWTVGRTLRSLGRLEEALSRQMELKKELDSAGEEDGYVSEEIGECLLALGRGNDARPYFANAYHVLSRDDYLVNHESERLARLKELGRVTS